MRGWLVSVLSGATAGAVLFAVWTNLPASPSTMTPLIADYGSRQAQDPRPFIGSSCWWEFDSYLPSKYETDWDQATPANDEHPCTRLSADVVKQLDDYWKLYHKSTACTSKESCPPIERTPTPLGPKPVAPDVFSKFRYKKVCGNLTHQKGVYWPADESAPATHEIVIEPLVGALRHPRYCHEQSFLLSKDYMFYSDPWLIKDVASPPVRFLYFDAGASSWTSGAGGASQSWILPEFTNRWCILNAGVWAWEAITWQADTIFNLIPSCLTPLYRWYNIKVSPDPASAHNMWRHIELVAQPEDYVVVKLDIDTPAVENPLIKELANSPRLHSLIDEMFFEYHCHYYPICQPWAICGDKSTPSYKDALALFSKIRQSGIRIHSWV